MTNVRKYTDKELLNRAKSLPSFKGFPKGYYIIGVQSLEDEFNKFDDKFYLYENTGSEFTTDINLQKFILTTSGTTNAGANGLLRYDSYNKEGYAVLKTNEVYYYVWRYGLHRGKMPALKQVRAFLISRDGDKDTKVEEGVSKPAIVGINFHANNYNLASTEVKEIIGGWSLGCQVCNDLEDYNKIIELIKAKKLDVTYILLKEF
jgi:hypothetical protein